MTVRSYANGYPVKLIVHDKAKSLGDWVYEDNGDPMSTPRPCARCGQSCKMVTVLDEDGDISNAPIDACIADVITALNRGGLPTKTSCCGHGVQTGWIALADGRILKLAQIGGAA